MRFLLKLVFVFFVLTLLVALGGLLLPSKYKFVQIEEIPVSRTIVYEQISDFRKWQNWSPWINDDQFEEVGYGSIYQGRKATMKISYNNRNECNLTITHAVGPESVAVDFDYGLKAKTASLWFVEPTPEGCKLNWTLNVSGLSLFERYMAFLNSDSYNRLMLDGMRALKEESLQLKYSRTGDISVIDMPSVPSVIKVDSVSKENVQVRLQQMDEYLKRFFDRRDIEPTGSAFKLVYGTVNDSLVKFALGYPIESRTWVWRTLEYFEIPEGKVLTIDHYGLPDKTNKAHEQLLTYINQTAYVQNGIPWEVSFFQGDSTQSDTSMWRTQVFVPVIQ